jgi:hypothetical protein
MEKGIWSEMHKLDFTNKLAKLCRILNNGIHARVNTGKHLYSECKVNKGLREGDAIAPLLFNVVLETAIRISKVETRGTIFDRCFKLWHMLMMWLLWEDYKTLKKYSHNWSKKQIRWD